MRAASTSRPAIACAIACAEPDSTRTSSGSVSHSACHPPRPRSCSCGIAANIVATSPGARTAAASATAQATGLRFCGIVEEPPRPGADGSAASAISLCASSETSRAILPRTPTTFPHAAASAAKRSRSACHGNAGSVRPSSRARASATSSPRPPSDARVPDAPPNCKMLASPSARSSPARVRRSAASQPAANSSGTCHKELRR